MTTWERAVYSVYYACLSRTSINLCVGPSFPFCFDGGMWDLITNHCLSIYFGGLL